MPSTPSRRPTPPVRAARVLAALALAALVAACSTLPNDAQRVEGAVVQSVADAFAGMALEDGVDLAPEVAGVATAATGPHVVVRRTDVERDVEVTDVVLDLDAEPATAVVDALLVVTGTAEIWEVDPDAVDPRTLLGTKPMDLRGAVRFDLERQGRAWVVTGVRRAPLVQGVDAADLGPWSLEPAAPLAGRPVAMALDVDAPQPDDRFHVRAHARVLEGVVRLNDAGVGVDLVADDGTYAGAGRIEAGAREGVRLVVFGALNHTATTDLSVDGDGAYVRPYTETLLPAWVYVRAAD